MSATRVGGGSATYDPSGIPGIPGPPIIGPPPNYPGHLPQSPNNLIIGAQPSPSSPWGASPFTNALIAARFAPAVRLNPITLQGPVTGGDGGWIQLSIDRPSFVWPTGYLMDGTTVNLPEYEVLFAPHALPRSDSQAMRSARRGIAYLSNPGLWWIKYNAPAAASAAVLNCLVIDANDPAVAGRYLSEPGCNGYNSGQVAVNAAGGGAVQLVAPNPYRKGLTIQNNGSQAVRVGIGGVAADWAAGGGFFLAAGTVPGTLSMGGDNLLLDVVFGISNTATPSSIYFVEYF